MGGLLVFLFGLTYFGQTEGKLKYVAVRLPLQGERSPPGSPWPIPAEWAKGSDNRTLDRHTFAITSDLDKCDIIDKAIMRYSDIIFGGMQWEAAPHLKSLKSLHIHVTEKTCTGYPQLYMDESYNLTVSDDATLNVVTVWGALRGLETFSQLVYVDNGYYMLRTDTIKDWPRYSHRGLMLDTARHYIPMPFIVKQLDAMTYNKMNVFHWHIVDDQSFPYVSSTFPELSEKGAYSQKQVYTPKDVADIIEYARLRGIRVIPEFDTPGHTQSFGKAFKYLMTSCWYNNTPATAEYGQHAKYENFDPTKQTTYDFLTKFFSEIKDVFKDNFIHMGMDEAHYMCWQSSPNISDFMAQQGFGKDEYFRVEEFYVKKALGIISGLKKRAIIWQDPVENNVTVSNTSIIQVWKNKPQWPQEYRVWSSYMKDVAAKGYNIIFSSCWYLNMIRHESSWREYYLCDPEDFNGTEEERARIVGGETCLWAEHVDESNIIPRTWPRAAATAERLWSPRNEKDPDSAQFRLHEQRCRMKRRGIASEPLNPGSCDPYYEDVLLSTPQSTQKPVPVCSKGSKGYTPSFRSLFIIIFFHTCVSRGF